MERLKWRRENAEDWRIWKENIALLLKEYLAREVAVMISATESSADVSKSIKLG